MEVAARAAEEGRASRYGGREKLGAGGRGMRSGGGGGGRAAPRVRGQGYWGGGLTAEEGAEAARCGSREQGGGRATWGEGWVTPHMLFTPQVRLILVALPHRHPLSLSPHFVHTSFRCA